MNLADLQQEERAIAYAFKLACQELEKITGTAWDDWEQELLNRANNWVYAEEEFKDLGRDPVERPPDNLSLTNQEKTS
jgi:hypothetical protein